MKLKLEVKVLRLVYFFVFFLGVSFIVLMHSFERPALDLFRVPTYIESASTLNGLPYFPTFKMYQITLIVVLVSILIDGLCLTSYRSAKLLRVSEIATIFGSGFALVALAFFTYNFFIVGESLVATTLVYLVFSAFLVALDFVTLSAEKELEKSNV